MFVRTWAAFCFISSMAFAPSSAARSSSAPMPRPPPAQRAAPPKLRPTSPCAPKSSPIPGLADCSPASPWPVRPSVRITVRTTRFTRRTSLRPISFSKAPLPSPLPLKNSSPTSTRNPPRTNRAAKKSDPPEGNAHRLDPRTIRICGRFFERSAWIGGPKRNYFGMLLTAAFLEKPNPGSPRRTCLVDNRQPSRRRP